MTYCYLVDEDRKYYMIGDDGKVTTSVTMFPIRPPELMSDHSSLSKNRLLNNGDPSSYNDFKGFIFNSEGAEILRQLLFLGRGYNTFVKMIAREQRYEEINGDRRPYITVTTFGRIRMETCIVSPGYVTVLLENEVLDLPH